MEFRVIVWTKSAIMIGIASWLLLNKPVGAALTPDLPVRKDQPWITDPRFGASVKAGQVKFKGMGKAGDKVEIVDNGRIVAVTWVKKDGNWEATGKLFGGKSKVYVRAVGGMSLASPARDLNVEGRSEQTLTIDTPIDGDYLEPGWLTIRGQGRAGDSILLSYCGRALARVDVSVEGVWSKKVSLKPVEEGEIRATSSAEGEIVFVQVTGSG